MIRRMQIRLYKIVKDHKLHSPMLAFEYFTRSFIPNCTSNHYVLFFDLLAFAFKESVHAIVEHEV